MEIISLGNEDTGDKLKYIYREREIIEVKTVAWKAKGIERERERDASNHVGWTSIRRFGHRQHHPLLSSCSTVKC